MFTIKIGENDLFGYFSTPDHAKSWINSPTRSKLEGHLEDALSNRDYSILGIESDPIIDVFPKDKGDIISEQTLHDRIYSIIGDILMEGLLVDNVTLHNFVCDLRSYGLVEIKNDTYVSTGGD